MRLALRRSSGRARTPFADLPADALPTWELVPAPRGAGRWLCADTAAGIVALAAPGVPLDSGSGEPLECWRRGQWRSTDDECEAIDLRPPDEVVPLRLEAIAELTGPEWHPWLRDVTLVLLQRVYSFGFVGTSAQPPKEARASATQPAYDSLREEALAVFPTLTLPEPARLPRRMPSTVKHLLRAAGGRGRPRRAWRRLAAAMQRRTRRGRDDRTDRGGLLG